MNETQAPRRSTAPGPLLASGTRSTIHAWADGVVAKVPKDATPEGWIRAEAGYVAAVHRCGAPAPRFIEITTLDGREVALYERIEGNSLWDELRAAPARAPEIGRLLAQIHAGLLAMPGPMALPSQHYRIRRKVRNAVARQLVMPPADLPELGSEQLMLCHGDLHPKNILMSPSGPIVVDWFDASRGIAAADVARTLVLLHGPEDETLPGHLQGVSSEALHSVRAAYLADITALCEVSSDDLERWTPLQVAAQAGELLGA